MASRAANGRAASCAALGWQHIFSDDKEGLLITIPLVAGEIEPTWPKEPLTPEKRDELLQWMFAGAARAYTYFKEDRRELAETAETYVRSEPKIGRNEPCPCGSGRKYKKCCGAADRDPAH
jgi:uncharacterized protein